MKEQKSKSKGKVADEGAIDAANHKVKGDKKVHKKKTPKPEQDEENDSNRDAYRRYQSVVTLNAE